MSHKRLRAGAVLAALTTVTVLGAGETAPAQEGRPRPSVNLYGLTGLIDMPSAEKQPDGQVTASFSLFGNTRRSNFTFQVLPWLSGTLRYATINDWGQAGDPGYNLFDRSFDVQIQLLNERGWRPSLALGFRDFLGTGVYSSEYLVASKTVADDFTLTAGVGWGRLSGEGHVENPFCAIADSMCTRDADFGEGGRIEWDTFFRGEDMGFFGGIEWRATDKLTLKAEYSSDAYIEEQESPASSFNRKSPLNFGAEYRWFEGVTLGGYYMYGDTVGVNLVVSGNPLKPVTPQNLGSGPLPVNPRPAGASRSGEWAADPAIRQQLTDAVAGALREDFIVLEEIRFGADTVEVFVVNQRINQPPKAIGRTARVLAIAMPFSVERFRITLVEDGLPTTTAEIDRSDLETQIDRPDAGAESWETVGLAGAPPDIAGVVRRAYPLVDWSLVPAPTFQIFGGNEGFRPQLNLEFRGSVQVNRGLSFSTYVRQPLLGVFDDPGPQEDDRTLPPVRRDSGRYYSGANPKLIRLTGDYLFKLNPDTYGRLSAGLLERGFGGVSGEMLWKPVDQSWGLGLELNYVAQRDFDNPFGFGFYDYDVAMGHASLYWDTGWHGIEAQLDAGRYLAGDWGGTLSVSRHFANGWSVGAFATKTDVPADEFGEGSFDKGVLVSIPLRWSTPFETRQTVDVNLRSLSSDGGAQLDIANRLYPIVRGYDRNRLEQNWGSFWQ